jgi:hypothetical protein
MKNPCLAAALAVLETHGVRDVEIARGAKHPQLKFKVNGGPAYVFAIPGSPSDWRSPQNTKRDMRNLLREIGVIAAPEPKPPPPPPRKADRVAELEGRVAALEKMIGNLVNGGVYDRRSNTV